MKKFEFSTDQVQNHPIFDGNLFYITYKDSKFLRLADNIETILTKGHELRSMLKEVDPGESVHITGMTITARRPLLVMKTGPNVTVENHQITANRLSGLVAAYAFDKRSRSPNLKSSEAMALGLKWDKGDENMCRLYLSAVSGTEHFDNQFQFWPLVCGLRKLQIGKITPELVVKMARIKNPDGVRMAQKLRENRAIVKQLWSYFPGSSYVTLEDQIKSLPYEVRKALLI